MEARANMIDASLDGPAVQVMTVSCDPHPRHQCKGLLLAEDLVVAETSGREGLLTSKSRYPPFMVLP